MARRKAEAMHRLAELDQRYIWHPFTQMRDWLHEEPIVIVRGKGAELEGVYGRRYLDANASIWTNLHGHNHPFLNQALRRQLTRIAHSSALGLANEPAALLAERLVSAANPLLPNTRGGKPRQLKPELAKVFYSDDGSTAMEVALKVCYEAARRLGRCRRPRFLSLQGAYHGDTVGAVSLGHIDLFHKTYRGLLFRTDTVMAPYCYRCRFNRARPERADARAYRRCRWECLDQLDRALTAQKKKRGEPYAGFVFEPLIQGAAGMIPQPAGWLPQACRMAREHGAFLIADEVMTGFGRTGAGERFDSSSPSATPPPLFACHHERVQPDVMALAKGMTGGYLPMAATLVRRTIFDAFLGRYEEFKTFFHGHSYTANQLGAAVALASLELLHTSQSVQARLRLERRLREELNRLWRHPHVGDIRQVGLVAGIELVRDWRTREPFALREQAGIRVCRSMAESGVLTRPIGNVVVIMPPYCTSAAQLTRIFDALEAALDACFGRRRV